MRQRTGRLGRRVGSDYRGPGIPRLPNEAFECCGSCGRDDCRISSRRRCARAGNRLGHRLLGMIVRVAFILVIRNDLRHTEI